MCSELWVLGGSQPVYNQLKSVRDPEFGTRLCVTLCDTMATVFVIFQVVHVIWIIIIIIICYYVMQGIYNYIHETKYLMLFSMIKVP